jgi:damage-control phosphatase, subfamily I
MRQAVSAARLATDDVYLQHQCATEAGRIISRTTMDMTPPEAGEELYAAVRRICGVDDPFGEQKQKQNRAVEDLLPWLRETVANADDTLGMAVRLAIAGNAVDPGAQESFDLEQSVTEAVGQEDDLADLPALKAAIAAADNVLLVADNCGEIVFDLVLLEALRDAGCSRLTVAVRSGPIINDVTAIEAREVGIDGVAEIIESGMVMPGTLLSRATPEFIDAFEGADLVISKGQGNWETLEDCEREVFFLLQAKCTGVAQMKGCRVGQPLLIHEPRLEGLKGRSDESRGRVTEEIAIRRACRPSAAGARGRVFGLRWLVRRLDASDEIDEGL